MDALRDSIQKLTRSVNPLGKLMDFLQEDIDSMQLEMTMWRNAYSTATADFKREQGYETIIYNFTLNETSMLFI